MSQAFRLIYITGAGHSGTTLLVLMLGSHSQIRSAGELSQAEQKLPDLLRSDSLCMCGVKFSECDYWQQVRKSVEHADGASGFEVNTNDLSKFASRNLTLLRAMTSVRKERFLCDSSKSLQRLNKLVRSSAIDLFVVHMVRDARAVAFSYQRKGMRRKRKGSVDSIWKKRSYGFYSAARSWNRNNLAVSRIIRRKKLRYCRVRYEDLVTSPEQQLRRVLANIGLEFEPQQLEFWAQEHHVFAGNRMRRKGPKRILFDQEYQHQISPFKWWLATFWANRGLRAYGYPLNHTISVSA